MDNHIISANHQLKLFLSQYPGDPHIPPADQNALNFYVKANGVLDAVAIPRNPVTPQWNAALNAIIGEANTTLALFLQYDTPPPSLLYGQIFTQREHTIAVANGLLVP